MTPVTRPALEAASARRLTRTQAAAELGVTYAAIRWAETRARVALRRERRPAGYRERGKAA